LIGDSRSGKTTLSETLRNGITKVDHLQLYSETREPKINSVVIDHNNKKINLNILDTPGLKEKKAQVNIEISMNEYGGYDLATAKPVNDNNNVRSDKEIIIKIVEFAKLKTSDIDLVFFVYDINKGISNDGLDSLNRFNQAFPELMQNCAIIFTKCEKISEDERKLILLDFVKMSIFKNSNMRMMFKKGVFFIGALDPFLIRMYPNLKEPEFMTSILTDINSQRDKIISLIVNNDKVINTKDLEEILNELIIIVVELVFLYVINED